MEEKKVEEEATESKQELKESSIVFVVALVVFVLALGGYFVYNRIIEKNEKPVKTNKTEITEKTETAEETSEKTEEPTEVETAKTETPVRREPPVRTETTNKMENLNIVSTEGAVITKEETEAFINELIFDFNAADLFIAEDDKKIFINSIKYLVFRKKYTKDGDQYILSQKDIQELAYRYYMKDHFDYISDDSSFVYDANSQTYRSGLNFGLVGPGPSFEMKKDMTDFNFSDGIATVTYNITRTYDKDEMYTTEDVIYQSNYSFQIVKVNDVLRMRSVFVRES